MEPKEKRLEREARSWAAAWSETNPDWPCDPDAYCDALFALLPADVPIKVGAALQAGLLVTDTSPGRGHFVGPPGKGSISTMSRHGQTVDPWREYFVQMAEYRSLCIAVRGEAEVRLEDGAMDISVRKGGSLLAFVEIKEKASVAAKLVAGMLRFSGQPLKRPSGPKSTWKDDSTKKAFYLIDEFSTAKRGPGEVRFSVRSGAVAGRALVDELSFVAHVDADAHTVTLREVEESVVEWADVEFSKSDVERASATLAWRIVRASKVPMFVDRGSVGTHLIYRVTEGVQEPVIQTQRDGAVRGGKGLSLAQVGSLQAVLDRYGVDLPHRHEDGTLKQHFIWMDRSTGVGWRPDIKLIPEIAGALADALASF